MVKRFLFISSIFLMSFSFSTNEYCKGWENGWHNGWKYIMGDFYITPIAPICPIPEIGRDSYKDGYNRGFAVAVEKAKKKKANK